MANPLIDDLSITPSTPPPTEENPLFSDLGISKTKGTTEVPEDKTPAAYDTVLGGNERVAGLAARAGAEGMGDLASLGAKAVHAVQDIPQWASWEMLKHMRHAFGMEPLPDSPMIHSPASEFTQGPSGGDVVDPLANKIGLPKPETGGERIGSAAVRAIPSVLTGEPETALPSLLPTMASGAASQYAAEKGAGPVGQTIAGVATGLAPGGIAAGLKSLARGGEAGAASTAQNIQNAENAGVHLSAGQATGSKLLRSAETTGANIPGGSALAETRGAGLNKQVEESVSNITKKLAPNYNQKPPTPMTAGENVEEAIKNRKQGLKNETTEVSNAMFEAGGGKDTSISAPKLHAAASTVTEPTGVPEVDKLITGAKTRKLANTATAVAEQPKVPTSYSTDGEGAHVVKSPNGETHFVEQANGDLKAWRSDTQELDDSGQPLRGKGEGTARLETGAHVATSKGTNLVSDTSVSHAEAGAYEKLRDRGWIVEKNPNAEKTDHSWVSDSPKNPVYTVKAPNTTGLQPTAPSAQVGPPSSAAPKSPNAPDTMEWTYNPKTGKSEPVLPPESPKVAGTGKAELNPETPWTIDSLKQFRTDIGQQIPGSKGAQKRQLQTMYGAASDDLRAHFSGKGPEAEQAWDLFNHVASQNAATQKTLTRAVKDLGGPEATFKAAMQGSKDGTTKLAPVMASLDDEGKNLFRATVLHRMGRAGGSADAPFDANTFLTNWKGMSPEGKNLLFGEGANAGPPTQLRKSLDSLSNTLDLLKNQGYIKSGFVKGVQQGTHGVRNLGILGAIALLGEHGGAAIMHVAAGHPFLAAGAVTGATGLLAGNPVMSRVLTNPKTAAWLAQATKAPAGMVPVLISQLSKMGTKDPDAKDLHDLIQQAGNTSGSPTVSTPKQDPTQTGLSEDQAINNNHKMVPMKAPDGSTFYGVDPNTFDQKPTASTFGGRLLKGAGDLAGRALNAVIPTANAADESKMIGGKPYFKIDSSGKITSIGGVPADANYVQQYIDRMTKALANNTDTLKSMPELASNPGMKKITEDMEEQIKNAKEILAKANKAKQKGTK